MAAVGGRARLNRVFAIMGVEYDDRLSLDEFEPPPSAVLAVPTAGSSGAGLAFILGEVQNANVPRLRMYAWAVSWRRLARKARNSL